MRLILYGLRTASEDKGHEGLVRTANRHTRVDRLGVSRLRFAPGCALTMDEPIGANDTDAEALSHDMIDVHGMQAASVARANARNAALAGRAALAKSWIKRLGVIRRRQLGPKPSHVTKASWRSTML